MYRNEDVVGKKSEDHKNTTPDGRILDRQVRVRGFFHFMFVPCRDTLRLARLLPPDAGLFFFPLWIGLQTMRHPPLSLQNTRVAFRPVGPSIGQWTGRKDVPRKLLWVDDVGLLSPVWGNCTMQRSRLRFRSRMFRPGSIHLFRPSFSQTIFPVLVPRQRLFLFRDARRLTRSSALFPRRPSAFFLEEGGGGREGGEKHVWDLSVSGSCP